MSGSTIIGGDNNDTLAAPPGGGSGSQVTIYGAGGDDVITGLSGSDILIGGQGADSISGGSGGDTIYGGGSYDSVSGLVANGGDNGAADTILGGPGNDLIYAGYNDYIDGGTGHDTVVLPDSGSWTATTVTGAVGGTTYTLYSDGNGHHVWLSGIETVSTTGGAPCYLEGTRIMTARGEVAVEDLRIGDLVVTAHGRGPVLQPVVWVGRRRVNLALHPNRAAAEPILVRAGALGENVPFRDLRVSPEHALFVDGRLVPAALLVNGVSIVREPWWQAVTWYHVELPEHGLLMAEGAPAESYFDAGNRHMFGEGALAALFPDFAAGRDERRYEEAACFPLLREEGPALAAIRARLAERAAAAFGPAPAEPAPGRAVRTTAGGRRARPAG
ncbi:Hint domain-containing protein [Caldovatus aquaticus]|uniref:Hint domain-containing protein n=1 Tax=Caldovatus aquaticus TaxID=2865671 RepID=A0ABS7F3G7_9PROT|nr:Hint domain-containing protein [Caldovatus aquaticus]MBW8270155.1 Hint domain-containing protein [Caldovatus aquaticus]